MPVVPEWIFGVRWGGGGGGGKNYLIINFMYILMQFLIFLKTNSRAEAMFASIQTYLNHTFGYIVMNGGK